MGARCGEAIYGHKGRRERPKMGLTNKQKLLKRDKGRGVDQWVDSEPAKGGKRSDSHTQMSARKVQLENSVKGNGQRRRVEKNSVSGSRTTGWVDEK